MRGGVRCCPFINFLALESHEIAGVERQPRVSPAVEQAFARLHEQGIKVCIATGRHMQEVRFGDLTGDIVFDGFVTLNGQYCLAAGPDYVTGDVNAGGLVAALRHFGLV